MSDAASKPTSSDSDDSYQSAKNALVSSLCELSTAATQTATAALNFYKAAGAHGVDAGHASASLNNLSSSLIAAANSASSSLTNGSIEPKKAPVKQQKKKEAPAPAPAPVAVPEKPAVSAPKPVPAPVAAEPAEPAVPDALATTDPALVKASAIEKAEKAEKPKKKRPEKDPNAPKKPVTSYLRFNLAVREEYKKERDTNGQPTLQATELNQIISNRWANLGEHEKSKLQKDYEADYEVYKKALEEYKAKKATDGTVPASQEPAPASAAEPSTSAPVAPVKAAPAAPAAPVKAAPAVPATPVKTAPAAQPAPAAESNQPVPAAQTNEKRKKNKKPKKTELSEVEAVAAAATEAARAALAAEAVQNHDSVQPKPSKKRKDKDPSEKVSKKKKKTTEPQAPVATA